MAVRGKNVYESAKYAGRLFMKCKLCGKIVYKVRVFGKSEIVKKPTYLGHMCYDIAGTVISFNPIARTAENRFDFVFSW